MIDRVLSICVYSASALRSGTGRSRNLSWVQGPELATGCIWSCRLDRNGSELVVWLCGVRGGRLGKRVIAEWGRVSESC